MRESGQRLRSSRVGSRMAFGVIVGGLLGGVLGVGVAVKRRADRTVAIRQPSANYVPDRSELSAARESNDSDDDASDPLVAWPLFGMAAGVIVGLGAALGYDDLRRLLRGTRP